MSNSGSMTCEVFKACEVGYANICSFIRRSIADCLPPPGMRRYSGSLSFFLSGAATSVNQAAFCCTWPPGCACSDLAGHVEEEDREARASDAVWACSEPSEARGCKSAADEWLMVADGSKPGPNLEADAS
mmetsp:Transcript_71101/g.211994  ORF Transcript_71101/g.211994 Transcript_71101/m.211994 type:complete len:130 (+) Transcript_71101:432-821(+)